MSLQTLLGQSLLYGLYLSVAMSALILWSLRLNAELWLGDYPPDIREAYGPVGGEVRRLRYLFGVPILLVPFAAAALLLVQLHSATA